MQQKTPADYKTSWSLPYFTFHILLKKSIKYGTMRVLKMPKIVLTNHAEYRLLERGIDFSSVKKVVKSTLKTKINSFDTIKVDGVVHDGKTLRVLYIKENNNIIIKTAYYL